MLEGVAVEDMSGERLRIVVIEVSQPSCSHLEKLLVLLNKGSVWHDAADPLKKGNEVLERCWLAWVVEVPLSKDLYNEFDDHKLCGFFIAVFFIFLESSFFDDGLDVIVGEIESIFKIFGEIISCNGHCLVDVQVNQGNFELSQHKSGDP